MSFRKPRHLYLLIIIIVPYILQAGARIVEFHAIRQNDTVILEWATEEESNLLRFEIERSTDNINWVQIGKKPAQGESSIKQYYSYTDNNLFKSNVSNFYYRLLIVEKSGQVTIHSVIASVIGISGIKHTWGSIKAMFR